ncbi:hypothetical protein [Shewanella sp. GXUN23E]|uniref:hypothetical protein n=1 Tax=Shewanella sp. GXUN23E TaxID=3422498 RepID=UPI003D7D16BF
MLRPLFLGCSLLLLLAVLLTAQAGVLSGLRGASVTAPAAETLQLRLTPETHVTLAPKRHWLGNIAGGLALPSPLPLMLLLLPVVMTASAHLRWPRDYLRFSSLRLGGWQELNLQFRFIQSRQ